MRVQGTNRNPKLVEPTATTDQKFRIHNIFIIDASGSMAGSKYANAISGVNEILQSIKKDTETINTVSIVEFEENNISKRLKFETLIPEQYTRMGTGGSTPLNQAVGETLEYVLEERLKKFSAEDKVLVNVFTDGEENASRGKYSGFRGRDVLGKLIKELEPQGFTVTFVGTQQEVNYAVQSLNLATSNTLVHDNSSHGVKLAFLRTMDSRVAYSKSVSRGEDVTANFYTKTVEEEKLPEAKK